MAAARFEGAFERKGRILAEFILLGRTKQTGIIMPLVYCIGIRCSASRAMNKRQSFNSAAVFSTRGEIISFICMTDYAGKVIETDGRAETRSKKGRGEKQRERERQREK